MAPTRHILFVDDEPNILAALRRMTRARRDTWTCHFAEGAGPALDILSSQPVDVVVSDMRMPGMDGAELLRRARDIRPQAARIILSGHSHDDSVLRAAGPAHQYLAKPCDQTALETTIDRALALRSILDRPELLDLVGGLDGLPSPAEAHLKLMRELDSPTSSASSIAALVSQDVGMLAELLKITNSQYFALTRAVTTAEQAVRILGVETVRLLALKVGLFRMFIGDSAVADIVRAIEQRAVEAAGAARREALSAGLPGHRIDHAVCAGMLHEVGLLVLLDRWPRRLLPLIDRVRQGAPLGPTLRQGLGASHGEVGGYLLGLWGFNDPVVEAVTLLDHEHASTDESVGAAGNDLLPLLRRAAAAVRTPL